MGRDGDATDITIRTYGSTVERYVARSPAPPAAVLSLLDSLAALVPGGHVLELGSGPGRDAEEMERRGLRVSRTDATPVFVERLRAAGLDARVLDARDPDYGGPFDAVFADAVLLHLAAPDAETAFGHARRAVRAGGVIGLTLKEGDGSGWSTAKLDRPRYFTYWRAPELVAALARSGWRIDSLAHVEGRHEPWLHVLAVTAGPDPATEREAARRP